MKIESIKKLTLALFFLGVCNLAAADQGALRIKVFPELSTADGRSQVDINVEVRDGAGRLVPDGTEVLFQTTLGALKDTSVLTDHGFARTVWYVGSIPGKVRITATALALRSTSTLDVDLLPAGALDGRDKEYVEVVSKNALRYSLDYQTLIAAAPDGGVTVRIGSVVIEADDVQIDVMNDLLKARKASMSNHGEQRSFDELFLKIGSRTGFGTTTMSQASLVEVRPQSRWLLFTVEQKNRRTLVEIASSGRVSPYLEPVSPDLFQFADLGDTVSFVKSKKAVLVPRKRIQFHRADVELDGRKALSLPLYEINLEAGAPQTFGEQILTFNDDKIGVDYPYYLSLKPGETSLMRLRAGQSYGRGVGGSGGVFLDYELKWDQGDQGEGGVTVSSLNTSGWSIDARQNYRLRDGATINGLVSMPGSENVFGSLNYSKPLGDMNLSIRGSMNRSLEGEGSDSDRISAALESKPFRAGGLPITLYYGLSASTSEVRSPAETTRSESSGFRIRGTFDTWRIDPNTSLAASFTTIRNWGATEGLGITGSAALTRRLGPSGSVRLNYEYTQSATSGIDDQQRLSLMGDYRVGRLDFNLFASQSLTSDWTSLYADASFRVSDLYRVYGSYTLDKYLGDENLDYSLTLAYRVGMREIGLNWSRRTGRLGLEILGSRF